MPQTFPTPFSGIFICYRRDDSAGHAGRLFDRLADHFGKDRIFMDIDSIEPGEDFVTVIEDAVSSCDILIAVIGRNWLGGTVGGASGLKNPHDFVRLEINTALNRDIRVIPVLVQRASMPKPQELPAELAKFTRRSAIELSDLRWPTDVEQLITVLERVLSKRAEAAQLADDARRAEEERQRLEEEERQRAEAENQLRLAEEAKKRAEAEQREKEEAARKEAEDRAKAEAEAALLEAKEERKKKEEENQRAEDRRRQREEERQRLSAIPVPKIETVPSDAVAERLTGHKEMTPARRRLLSAIIVCAMGLLIAVVVFIVWALTTSDRPRVVANNQPSVQTAQPNPQPSDSKPAPPPGMVYVPGGKFTMGRNDGDEFEGPAHETTVQSFFIDINEVTNEDYEKYVRAGHPAPTTWRNGTYPSGAARKPVTGVTWKDADAYAKSLGKRLPSEAEWEFAARGGKEEWLYPWGNDWSPGMANADPASKTMVDVCSYKDKEASPFRLCDMVGNAWEWPSSKYSLYTKDSLTKKTYPGFMVIRGCMYSCDSKRATATFRRRWPASGLKSPNTGFRCAKYVAR